MAQIQTNSKRLFIAVEPNEELRRSIQELVERLRSRALDPNFRGTWVRPENIHLTLKFLGSTSYELIPSVCQELKAAVETFSPFEIGLSGLGSFAASRSRGRLSSERTSPLWVGVEDFEHKFEVLFRSVEEAMSRLGFAKETRGFSPHLTLARISAGRRGWKPDSVFAGEPALSQKLGVMRVNDVILFESETLPDGPRHSKICQLGLRGV